MGGDSPLTTGEAPTTRDHDSIPLIWTLDSAHTDVVVHERQEPTCDNFRSLNYQRNI